MRNILTLILIFISSLGICQNNISEKYDSYIGEKYEDFSKSMVIDQSDIGCKLYQEPTIDDVGSGYSTITTIWHDTINNKYSFIIYSFLPNGICDMLNIFYPTTTQDQSDLNEISTSIKEEYNNKYTYRNGYWFGMKGDLEIRHIITRKKLGETNGVFLIIEQPPFIRYK